MAEQCGRFSCSQPALVIMFECGIIGISHGEHVGK